MPIGDGRQQDPWWGSDGDGERPQLGDSFVVVHCADVGELPVVEPDDRNCSVLAAVRLGDGREAHSWVEIVAALHTRHAQAEVAPRLRTPSRS